MNINLQVDSIINEIANEGFHDMKNGIFVPGAFSVKESSNSHKYWRSFWPGSKVMIFYGLIDYTVFWWPDTVAYQMLKSGSKVDFCIGFLHPNKRINEDGLKPQDIFLRRFQGVMWDAFKVAVIPCNHIGENIESPKMVSPLFEQFNPIQMKVSTEKQAGLNILADELKISVKNRLSNGINEYILDAKSKLNCVKGSSVSNIIRDALSDILFDLKYLPHQTKFQSLWRKADGDFHYISENENWPKHLFIEIKTTEDINAPVVQAAEDLAAYDDCAVIQMRIIWPGNTNPLQHPMVDVAKKQMESLGVCYRDLVI